MLRFAPFQNEEVTLGFERDLFPSRRIVSHFANLLGRIDRCVDTDAVVMARVNDDEVGVVGNTRFVARDFTQVLAVVIRTFAMSKSRMDVVR